LAGSYCFSRPFADQRFSIRTLHPSLAEREILVALDRKVPVCLSVFTRKIAQVSVPKFFGGGSTREARGPIELRARTDFGLRNPPSGILGRQPLEFPAPLLCLPIDCQQAGQFAAISCLGVVVKTPVQPPDCKTG
jgi:hypothetical protein